MADLTTRMRSALSVLDDRDTQSQGIFAAQRLVDQLSSPTDAATALGSLARGLQSCSCQAAAARIQLLGYFLGVAPGLSPERGLPQAVPALVAFLQSSTHTAPTEELATLGCRMGTALRNALERGTFPNNSALNHVLLPLLRVALRCGAPAASHATPAYVCPPSLETHPCDARGMRLRPLMCSACRVKRTRAQQASMPQPSPRRRSSTAGAPSARPLLRPAHCSCSSCCPWEDAPAGGSLAGPPGRPARRPAPRPPGLAEGPRRCCFACSSGRGRFWARPQPPAAPRGCCRCWRQPCRSACSPVKTLPLRQSTLRPCALSAADGREGVGVRVWRECHSRQRVTGCRCAFVCTPKQVLGGQLDCEAAKRIALAATAAMDCGDDWQARERALGGLRHSTHSTAGAAQH
jgi:hypothetical protein